MVDDLDKTLEALIRAGLPKDLRSKVTLAFDPPDAKFPPSSMALPALDLFLYDVRENRELRSNEVVLERRRDGTGVQTRSPVRIDCSYLITAWADAPAVEHQWLGEAIRVLVRHSAIPADVLQGQLRNQDAALPMISLQPGRFENVAEFWQALGARPKPALTCTITVPVQAFDAEEARLVTEKVLKLEVMNPDLP